MVSFLSLEKSTNVRDFGLESWWDGVTALFHPRSRSRVMEGRDLYLLPERRLAPPALPEPAGGMVLVVPGFTPHLAARIWGADRGPTAPLIVLVHDWEGQIYDMMPFVQPLLDAGARVVAFDAPAHGRSAGEETHVLDMVRAIRAVAMAAGGSVTASIAHGLGATALALAMQEGFDPGRAVLLAPLADLMLPVRQIAQVLRLDTDGEHDLTLAIDQALGRPLAGLHVQGNAEVPALLVHSSDDRIMPVADALHLAAGWPGMAVHLVEGLGHRRLLSDPAVQGLVLGFALASA